MQTWQMQTAKARFSDVIRSAKKDGPQDITVHGKSVAVVLSRDLFDRLSGNSHSFDLYLTVRSFLYEVPMIGISKINKLACASICDYRQKLATKNVSC